MTALVPPFTELLAAARHSAVHLEMRDVYTTTSPRFLAWQAGLREDPSDRAAWWNPFWDAVADAVARGVVIRRSRIVSEPVSEYVRFEYDVTFANIVAGEKVRWLPRRKTSDLALPGNDFWLFDDRLVRFGHFAGNGDFIDNELMEDPKVVQLCASAFEAVWGRATPHEQYRPN